MRRVTLILPNLLSSDEQGSVLLEPLANLRRIAELGRIERLTPLPEAQTIEAAWLGLNPARLELAQGPLVVSALGVDPPPYSVHFHLSLLSIVGAKVLVDHHDLPAVQVRMVMEQARKLETRTLKIVEGEGADHGLVWESGSPDLHAYAPSEAEGLALSACLPEGDGESMLRQFIDDSVNLLTDLPLNKERADGDLPPLNLLWPWGPGFRRPVPNLLIERGEYVQVESASLRLEGLTRLVKWRHGERGSFGKGLNTRAATIKDRCLTGSATIALIEAFTELRSLGRLDEARWLAQELDNELLAPLLERTLVEPMRLTLLAPGGPTAESTPSGLAVTLEHGAISESVAPFDERALEERALPILDAWDVVAESLRWAAPVPDVRGES